MFALLGWSLPLQIAVNGLVLGLGYAVLAAGIVLIYRSSGIVNFAQAAMGAFGVACFVVLVQNYDLPYPPAMALGVAASVAVGVVTELLVVRRLFDASRVVLLIATVGVAQLLALAILEGLPDFAGGGIPVAFDADWSRLELAGNLTLGSRQTSVILLVTPVLIALGWFLNRTTLGLHIRAVADSPENARLVGVSPKRVSTLVWGLAAGFAAYTQIAMAPLVTNTAHELAGVSTIGLLLRALVVALLARMRSIPVVVLGGLALGVVESMVSVNLNRDPGVFNAFLFLFVLVLGLVGARNGRGGDEAGFSVGVTRRPVPEHLDRIWWVRRLPTFGMGLFVVAALAVPQFVTKPSELLTWTELLVVAMVAVSLSLLTGWAGQLSLGQFAFAGVGGLSMLAFTQGHPLGIGLPWVGHIAEVTIELPWFAALAAATGVGVLFAALVGLPALRVRGLFLAVTTLAFANMAATWMFSRDFWTGGRSNVASVTRDRPSIGGFEFVDPDRYYYLCLAFLVLTVVVVSRLRRTGPGRAMIAVRDNEPMTSAATIAPTRAKLSAFAVSGGIAALAGSLYVYLLPGFAPTSPEGPFSAGQSLQLVAIAIIGGIGTVAGPILGALWVVGLPAAFGANDTVRLLSANIGLLVLLLYFPGGLVQILYSGRDKFFDWLTERIPAPEPAPEPASDGHRPATLTARERDVELPPEGKPWLDARDVTVAFGGVRAVDGASFQVHAGELVGLIGTNGAGKSTLMNAVSGFVPHTGRIEVLGHDVSSRPAHRRHAVGLGRGFQDAQLFPGLTVRETVLVALEARRHSLLVPSMLALPPSPGVERHRRTEADEILTFLGLGPDANHLVADLSTGTRRIMELACLIATDAKVLLLDEPTGGLAQKEAEAFPALIRQVQKDLDAAVVVIEHDMPLIMGISDRVYCMEAGQVIASGAPADVRSDPGVIASYLGTDDRAIARTNHSSGDEPAAEAAEPAV
jgi:ABC-type branched-subunit amino acid transport system ATPase component/ABC-type branched-subunit amino acid transport system permease subunit